MPDAISNIANPPGNSSGGTYVVLPCSQDNFREFVAGLLGKPQETKGEVEGVFRITRSEIANVFHLVDQRVKKQNDATLIHFSISVYYSDGSSITHNTVAAFDSHHQTSNCYAVAVAISLNYLVKFNDRPIPEKQEIDVVINTDPELGYMRGGRRWFHSGLFSYKILHTEITWATDIAGLLKSHAESIVESGSKLKIYLYQHSEELMSYWFLLIFVSLMVIWGRSAVSISDQITTVQGAVKYISVSLSVFLGLAAVLFGLRGIYDRNLFLRTPSFIVLSKKDEEQAKKISRKNSYIGLGHLAGWVIGLASGVVSNFLYSWLTT